MEATDTPRLETADSMEAAAAQLAKHPDSECRLSIDQLKRAKTAGCPAFRGSRVYLEELLTWWEDNSTSLPTGDTELDRLNRELAAERLRKLRIANDAEEGKYIDKATYTARVEKLAGETLAILRRKLEEEAPRRQQGKTEDELRPINRDLVDEICIAVEAALSA